jgi:uncharacterized protein YkwD
MKVHRVLRPAQRILTAVLVTAVAAACLVSAPSATSIAPARGADVSAVTRAPVALVAQAAFPAFSRRYYERRVLNLVNRTRERHHLGKVSPASCTDKVANRWSAHLATTNAFKHQSMTSLLRRCHARYVGEVLGRGTIKPATLVDMWMHSPPHRHVLLSKKPRRIGVGATPNSRGEWVVTANFMRF